MSGEKSSLGCRSTSVHGCTTTVYHGCVYHGVRLNDYELPLAAAAPACTVLSAALETFCWPSVLAFKGLLLASGGGRACGGIKLVFREGLIASSEMEPR